MFIPATSTKSKRSATATLLAVAAALAMPSAIAAQCTLDGSSGLLLAEVRDSAGRMTCRPGYYCPNLDPDNASTFPVSCPPSPACQVDRLFGKACDPEIFEPRPCPSGKYCPTFNVTVECPVDHFCPEGSPAPIKCEVLSLCAAGSDRSTYLGGFLFSGILGIALIGIVILYKKKLRFRGVDPAAVPLAASPSAGKGVEMGSRGSPRSAPDEYAINPVAAAPEEPIAASVDPAIQTICDGFAAARGERPPIRIDAGSIRVSLPDGKPLLRGVSGNMRPGKVTAIMGPSGAGKTVFMTALLGNTPGSWSTDGDLRANGKTIPMGSMRQHIAFVPQDDALHSELSVDANLFYSSETRLPPSWDSDRRAALREAIISRLGLTAVRSMPTEEISASQRKLCSVGVELCAAPQVLFLDEPTSGLDSTTSLLLVRLLKELAVAAELTVVMVVHQPRVEIWDELDEVLFLAPGGTTVYQGYQKNAIGYFAGQGVAVRPQDNPADVLMDCIAAKADELVASWKTSEENEAGSCPQSALVSHGVVLDLTDVMPKASFLRQFCLSHVRSVEKQLSHTQSLAIELFVAGILGALMGTSLTDFELAGLWMPPYEALSPVPELGMFPRLNMYMMMSIGLAASIAGVNLFSRERQQYFREAQAGYNRVAYYLGNATSGVYRVVFAAMLFESIMITLGAVATRYSIMLPTTILAYACFYGAATCISVVVSPAIAPLIASMLSIIFGVFSGSIPFPDWMKRIFFSFYYVQIQQYELSRHIDGVFQDTMGNNGHEADKQGESFAVLIAWIIGTYALALALMLLTHREKQR